MSKYAPIYLNRCLILYVKIDLTKSDSNYALCNILSRCVIRIITFNVTNSSTAQNMKQFKYLTFCFKCNFLLLSLNNLVILYNIIQINVLSCVTVSKHASQRQCGCGTLTLFGPLWSSCCSEHGDCMTPEIVLSSTSVPLLCIAI